MNTLLDMVSGRDALVYGIGNAGREDDGLGWAFIDALESSGGCGDALLLRRYQLALEDADLLGRRGRVLFVDSTRATDVETYAVTRPLPDLDFTFTSHALSVPALLATTQVCAGRVPQVWVLAIRGYSWDLRIGLTHAAYGNLELALQAARSPEGLLDPRAILTGGAS